MEGLLANGKSAAIHNRNLQQVVKKKNNNKKLGIMSILKNEVFNLCDNNNNILTSSTHRHRTILQTTQYRPELITNLEANLWDLVPQNIKETNSLSNSTNKINKWIRKKCSCRL